MRGNSILIVAGDAPAALELKQQLQALGYPVAGTAHGSERAVVLTNQLRPDLILVDVRRQGGHDGLDAAAAIQRSHALPVVLLASPGDALAIVREAQIAVHGCLVRPCLPEALSAGLEAALAKADAERRQRASDQWCARTLRALDGGVVVAGMDARVRFMNLAAQQLTGWSLDDAAGREVGEVVRYRPDPGGASSRRDAATSEDPVQTLVRVLDRGTPAPLRLGRRLVTRDGRERLVDESAAPIDDGQGERLGAVLMLRDASMRAAQEKLLRASEERFRSAFDCAPLGMALVSTDGEFLQVNDALCELLGASRSDLTMTGPAALTQDDERDDEHARLQQLRTGRGDPARFEKRWRRLDGRQPVSTQVHVSLLPGPDRTVGYLYQVHDLTDAKNAAAREAELALERTTREAAEIAGRIRRSFLSRASHEMRTPLNAVIGFAQLLQTLPASQAERVGPYGTYILEAAQRLLCMIDDLLDIQDAGQGGMHLSLRPVGAAEALGALHRSLQGDARALQLLLELQDPGSVRVMAHPARLGQVLRQLGSNAVKFNRPQGRVLLRVEPVAQWVRLIVEDSGIGMTAAQLERLFQPFDRLDRERSTTIAGVGLGLATARALAAEMGGDLEISSQPGQGTRAVLRLPHAPEVAAAEAK